MNNAPILQQLNGNQINQLQAMMPQLKAAKQAMQAVQMAQNPQLALQQMLQNNPRYGDVMKVLSAFNGDTTSAVNTLCREKGIDPVEFMNALNQI